MQIPLLVAPVCTCSAGLYSILEKHYPQCHSNKDQYIWENNGFIIANLHYLRALSNEQVIKLATEIALLYAKVNEQLVQISREAIINAIAFYTNCFYEMFVKKTWTLPDKIVYNLLRPQSWNNYDAGLPIGEIDIIEIIEVWAKTSDFITHNCTNIFKSYLNSIQ